MRYHRHRVGLTADGITTRCHTVAVGICTCLRCVICDKMAAWQADALLHFHGDELEGLQKRLQVFQAGAEQKLGLT